LSVFPIKTTLFIDIFYSFQQIYHSNNAISIEFYIIDGFLTYGDTFNSL